MILSNFGHHPTAFFTGENFLKPAFGGFLVPLFKSFQVGATLREALTGQSAA